MRGAVVVCRRAVSSHRVIDATRANLLVPVHRSTLYTITVTRTGRCCSCGATFISQRGPEFFVRRQARLGAGPARRRTLSTYRARRSGAGQRQRQRSEAEPSGARSGRSVDERKRPKAVRGRDVDVKSNFSRCLLEML